MSLAARLDEMIVLYTLDRLTVREIADRYGAAPVTVKMMLVGAGVPLERARPERTRRTAPQPLAQPPQPVRCIDPEVHERTVHESGDRDHLLRIRHALSGKGFPFYTFRSAA